MTTTTQQRQADDDDKTTARDSKHDKSATTQRQHRNTTSKHQDTSKPSMTFSSGSGGLFICHICLRAKITALGAFFARSCENTREPTQKRTEAKIQGHTHTRDYAGRQRRRSSRRTPVGRQRRSARGHRAGDTELRELAELVRVGDKKSPTTQGRGWGPVAFTLWSISRGVLSRLGAGFVVGAPTCYPQHLHVLSAKSTMFRGDTCATPPFVL